MFNVDEIYTVSDFLSLCNRTIENNIPSCWLQGEISNLSRPASGHWYFSLKDNKSQIRCALFRLAQRDIKFKPENGMEVLIRAVPTIYEARGDFQIIVQKIEPVGVGNLQLAFDQLKNTLKNEGLFDLNHKKTLPKAINAIGVISSSNGAVISDIIKVLSRRYPSADILLFDCVVQGEGAADKLANAVDRADQSNRCDVLIIARGGGSLEDLWAFNEEVLARAIFVAKTPIISAVGHETDVTIADFVSDVRAPTPSAAAVIATPDRLELLASSDMLLQRLRRATNQIIDSYLRGLSVLYQRVSDPSRQINFFAQKLDGLITRLNYQLKTNLRLNSAKLNNTYEQLKRHSPSQSLTLKKETNTFSTKQLFRQIKQLINSSKNNLNHLDTRLSKSITAHVVSNRNILSGHAKGLDHLSPLNTLSRGFSITSNENNEVIQSRLDIKINQTITTQLADGKIRSKIINIESN
jgi:exodeoxyribonuclease VII large subunit